MTIRQPPAGDTSSAADVAQASEVNSEAASARPVSRQLTLAGGCFWCLDALYRRCRGVQEVVSGYTGGHTPAPDYRSVCSGVTGHAEAVRVRFDESIVPADVILRMFFAMHNPTTLNRQGYDIGTQYRSALFVSSPADEELFLASIAEAQQHWNAPIVTTLEPLGAFFPAESIHQNYYEKFPEAGYCQAIVNPKLSAVRRSFAAWLD